MPNLLQHSIEVICDGQHANGAYVASPTFSQYGYSWLRDGAWIAHAMAQHGYTESATAFHLWAIKTVQRYAPKVEALLQKQSRGETLVESDFLPTRFELEGDLGTEYWPDFQLDGYGAWLWVLAQFCKTNDHPLCQQAIPAIKTLVSYLGALWQSPNYDCWEEHRQHVHTATLAALYGGLKAIRELHPSLVPLALVEDIHAFILAHCVAPQGHFMKFVGNHEVDSSLLWVAVPYGVVEVTDSRFVATLAKIERDIVAPDGGVYRYRADTYFGGGEWLLLTAWLGWTYARLGRLDEAQTCLQWVEAQAAPNGDMPEQVANHLLDAGYFQGWVDKWGTSALPLLWSHAMYLLLVHELKVA
jgi:GH15 family glucan-1,4-alpha-glucosidase